jgi:hypothetical protein
MEALNNSPSAIEDLEDRSVMLRQPPRAKAPPKYKAHRRGTVEELHSQTGAMANPSGHELASALTEMGVVRNPFAAATGKIFPSAIGYRIPCGEL